MFSDVVVLCIRARTIENVYPYIIHSRGIVMLEYAHIVYTP